MKLSSVRDLVWEAKGKTSRSFSSRLEDLRHPGSSFSVFIFSGLEEEPPEIEGLLGVLLEEKLMVTGELEASGEFFLSFYFLWFGRETTNSLA